MVEKLFIHIGTHKTGTKSIQSFLAKNKQILLEGGVLYPGDLWGHHHLVTKEGYKAFIREQNQESWTWVEDQLNGSDVPVGVISSENFSTGLADSHPDYIADLYVRTKAYNPSIVVYLRRQDFFCESLYTQFVKTGNRLGYRDIVEMSKNLNLDYFGMLECWAHCFGKENIKVRRFREEPSFDVLQDFLDAIDWRHKGEPKWVDRIHCKPHLDHLRALVYLQSLTSPQRGLTVDVCSSLVEYTHHWPSNRDYRLMPYSVARDLLAQYETSNTAVATGYMGVDGEPLFNSELKDYAHERLGLSEMSQPALLDLMMFVRDRFVVRPRDR